jgi:hypothetical protein
VPYEIVKVDGGEKVRNIATGNFASTRLLPHITAVKQFRLLKGLEEGWHPTGEPSDLDKKD